MFGFAALRAFFGGIASKISLPIGFFVVVGLVLLAIIIPNIGAISQRLGFETKESVKVELAQTERKLEEVIVDNKALAKAVEASNAAGEAKVAAIASVAKEEAKTTSVVDLQIARVLKANPKPKPKKIVAGVEDTTPTLPDAPDQDSKVAGENQITALWTVYCDFNTDQACQAKAKAS